MEPTTRTPPESAGASLGRFVTTHWSVVLAAGDEVSAGATEALEQLCRAYWYPLYAYVRRQGHSPEDAQDLTQEFFARLLERKSLQLADPDRGRFRTFLLCSLKRFLINEWKQANCQKRGGGRKVISLDTTATEGRLQAEPPDHRTPEKAFERRWALLLLSRVLDQLEAEWIANERGPLFHELKPFLMGEDSNSTYAEIASRCGLSEGSVKITIHRLRHRFRELLRQEVAMTVDGAEAVDEEILHLMAALSEN
jgi:RNA polymerase sigma-70 factor (ECF subfamily)